MPLPRLPAKEQKLLCCNFRRNSLLRLSLRANVAVEQSAFFLITAKARMRCGRDDLLSSLPRFCATAETKELSVDIDDLAKRTCAITTPTTSAGSNNKDGAAADIDQTAHLTRIAHLVAVGQLELPVDAPSDELSVIVRSICRHNCLALVRHIARCIANELSSPTKKEKTDD